MPMPYPHAPEDPTGNVVTHEIEAMHSKGTQDELKVAGLDFRGSGIAVPQDGCKEIALDLLKPFVVHYANRFGRSVHPAFVQIHTYPDRFVESNSNVLQDTSIYILPWDPPWDPPSPWDPPPPLGPPPP
jgi:hypothetical protein